MPSVHTVPPPLVPPRGEVNAADAFDIGSFDEDDVKGIKVIFLAYDHVTRRPCWLITSFPGFSEEREPWERGWLVDKIHFLHNLHEKQFTS